MISLLLPTGILAAAGLVTIASVAPHLFALQIIWIILGAGLLAFFYFVDWRLLLNYRWFIGGIYALAIFLLILTYIFAPVIRNTRSWIVFGPFDFQPVEIVKVALILIYANYFSKRHLNVARWKNIFESFLIFIAPAALVLLQPDLGSTLLLFGLWFGFLLLSGLPRRRVAVAIIAFAIIGFVGWSYALKDYQRERIVGVFYPEKNLLGINYSAAQSKIAIGSAGLLGKGFKQGTQSQLGFLTEPANDFVYAAFTEEWGFLGGLVVVAAFLFLVFRILKIGMEAEHNFERFICLGVAIIFGLEFTLNVGSVLGLTPVIGLTFPFMSYGGSSLTTSFLLLSLVNAIAREKR